MQRGEVSHAHTDNDRLRERSVGLGGVLFQSITGMAPASAVAFSLGLTAAFAGLASPLSIALATIGCLLVGTCIGQLAKSLSAAGGLYTYVSRTLGPSAGFVTAWGIGLMELMVTPFLCLLVAWLLDTVFTDNVGVHLGWVIWFVLALAIVLPLTYRDVRISTRVGAWLGMAEIAILAIWMIVAHRNNLPSGVFNPSHAPGGKLSGVFKGVVFGVLAFGGFEVAAPFGEEARNAGWAIPRAVLLAPLAMGAFYLLGVYGWIAGAGPTNFVAQATAGGNPWLDLGRRFWGEGWLLILFALINSNLASANAQVNATSRMFFAMGRNGILPRAMSRTHSAHRTPHIAIYATTALSLVIGLAAGTAWGPLTGFSVLATVYTILLVLLYMAVALSSSVHYLGERRKQFNPLLHGLIPIAGIVLFAFALYYQYSPLPAAPIVIGDWVAVGWLGVGLVALLAAQRWLPDGLERARHIFIEDPTATASPANDQPSTSPIGDINV